MDLALNFADRWHCDPFRFLDMSNEALVALALAVGDFDQRKRDETPG